MFRACSRGFIGPQGPGPIGPMHLLGPVGPRALLGPFSGIHLLGPVGPGPIGPIHLLGLCWADSRGGVHDKWSPNKRWGAVQHIKQSGTAIHIYPILKQLTHIQKHSLTCSNIYNTHTHIYIYIYIYICIGGDARDIAEPTYKGFNQLLDTNPTAYKGFDPPRGFQPTTRASTNLLHTKNLTAYKRPNQVQGLQSTTKVSTILLEQKKRHPTAHTSYLPDGCSNY